jgi:hypothetical protein
MVKNFIKCVLINIQYSNKSIKYLGMNCLGYNAKTFNWLVFPRWFLPLLTLWHSCSFSSLIISHRILRFMDFTQLYSISPSTFPLSSTYTCQSTYLPTVYPPILLILTYSLFWGEEIVCVHHLKSHWIFLPKQIFTLNEYYNKCLQFKLNNL